VIKRKYLFKHLAITQKLTLIMVGVSAVSLLSTVMGFVGYQVFSAREAAKTELSTLAKVIGTNCSAALIFSDTKSARETLEGLRTAETVAAACIYRSDGKPFACYKRNQNSLDGSSLTSKANWFSAVVLEN
jgi:HPt (histidine-containing phosphotransfer) domain-containing protein